MALSKLCILLNECYYIRSYAPGKEKFPKDVQLKPLMTQLKEEFYSREDPQFLESLKEFDFSEQVCIGNPATTKKGKAKKSDMFYFFDLSPFSRESIGEK